MIAIKDLNLRFSNNDIFKNQNFTISRGDKLLLLKESGAGKTTLFKLIQGLIKPDSGDFYINNIRLNCKNIHAVRASIFYLDQDVSLPELPIIDLIHTINSYKLNKNCFIDIKNFKEYCDLFKLKKDTLDKNISELSGGERQRIGLIIGFLQNKPIWLLDEPTSALDSDLKDLVSNMIQELKETTILVISHDDIWNKLNKLSWEV